MTIPDGLEDFSIPIFMACHRLIAKYERRRRAPRLKAFPIERILAHRQRGDFCEYLVQWVGYRTPTWEPIENFFESRELLRTYYKDYFQRHLVEWE